MLTSKMPYFGSFKRVTVLFIVCTSILFWLQLMSRCIMTTCGVDSSASNATLGVSFDLELLAPTLWTSQLMYS
jgi:hypothetical protein